MHAKLKIFIVVYLTTVFMRALARITSSKLVKKMNYHRKYIKIKLTLLNLNLQEQAKSAFEKLKSEMKSNVGANKG